METEKNQALFFGACPTLNELVDYYGQQTLRSSSGGYSKISEDFQFSSYDSDWVEEVFSESSMSPVSLIDLNVKAYYLTYPWFLSLDDFYEAAAIANNSGLKQCNVMLQFGDFWASEIPSQLHSTPLAGC
jgi:hypothetical protein